MHGQTLEIEGRIVLGLKRIPVQNLQHCTAPQKRFKIAVQLNYSCSAAF